jgi:hypothetical protein
MVLREFRRIPACNIKQKTVQFNTSVLNEIPFKFSSNKIKGEKMHKTTQKMPFGQAYTEISGVN